MIPASVIIFFASLLGILFMVSRRGSQSISVPHREHQEVLSVELRKKINAAGKKTYEKAVLWTTKGSWHLMHGIETKIKKSKNRIEEYLQKKHEEDMKREKTSNSKHLRDLKERLDSTESPRFDEGEEK